VKTPVRKMLFFLSSCKTSFATGQVAMLVHTAAGLAFPWAVRGIFDLLFADGPQQDGGVPPLLAAIGILGLVSVAREVASYVRSYALGYASQKIIRDLRGSIYQKLLALSLDYYDQKNTGEITSSMSNDVNLFQQGLSTGLTQIVQQSVTLIAVIVLLLRLDAVLAGTAFLILPLVILVSRKAGAKVRAISSSAQERLGYLMTIITESISGIDVIKAFVLEHHALGLFRDENDRLLLKSVQGIRASAAARLSIGLLNALFLLAIIGLGAYRVSADFLSPADLIAFILYSEMIAGPISMLSSIYVELNGAMAAFQRISEILNAPGDFQRKRTAVAPPAIGGHIEFQDVSFSYDGQTPTLKHVSCSISPGETVALVGPSGAGKSTFVKLVPRFYEPQSGAILIDGIDIQTMDLGTLRRSIAIVPQETHLFGFSIAENIACGMPEASQEEIERAAQLANAHAFILEQARGYQTEIGEGGARLSGGQRQRIAIARAFLKDPRILILDEATSALDAQSESQVRLALEHLMEKRTTLIIAHRLSTIENADQILVLKDGTILATGTHTSLLETCDFYRDLYEKQFA